MSHKPTSFAVSLHWPLCFSPAPLRPRLRLLGRIVYNTGVGYWL